MGGGNLLFLININISIKLIPVRSQIEIDYPFGIYSIGIDFVFPIQTHILTV
jgi:hypothetical protein